MSQLRRLRTLDFKTLIGVLVGFGALVTGLTIYSNHGFSSSMIFLLGLLMIPLGLIVLGTVLVKVPQDEEVI